MKAENITTNHNRRIRIVEIEKLWPHYPSTMEINISYVEDNETSRSTLAVILDHQIIPAILVGLNNAKETK